MATAEIEVFGAGVFGLSVAYACLKRGAKVRLIEKRRIGAGASGGVVGALAPHSPDNWNDKKQFQFESLIAAQAYWAEVDELSGLRSGYTRTGRLVPVVDQSALPLAQARTETAKIFWKGCADWNVVEPGLFRDWEPDSPTGYLIHDTLSARLNPRPAGASLAGAIFALGGQMIVGKETGKGADATVICTGYEGLSDLTAELGAPIGSGVKGQGMSLRYDGRYLPQISAEGIYIVPHEDGTTAIGSTSEKIWDDATSTDERLEELHANAIRICPALKDAEVIRRWAGVRPRSTRRTPILGRHPTREKTFIANGGFKIGFGIATKVGEVMADLVLNGQADIPEKFTVEGNLK